MVAGRARVVGDDRRAEPGGAGSQCWVDGSGSGSGERACSRYSSGSAIRPVCRSCNRASNQASVRKIGMDGRGTGCRRRDCDGDGVRAPRAAAIWILGRLVEQERRDRCIAAGWGVRHQGYKCARTDRHPWGEWRAAVSIARERSQCAGPTTKRRAINAIREAAIEARRGHEAALRLQASTRERGEASISRATGAASGSPRTS